MEVEERIIESDADPWVKTQKMKGVRYGFEDG
jgi:hypothetical protein